MANKTRYVGVIIDYVSSKSLLPDYPEDGKYLITGRVSGNTEDDGYPLYAEFVNSGDSDSGEDSSSWVFTPVSATLPGGLTAGDTWTVKNKNQYLIRVVNSAGFWDVENIKHKRYYKLSSIKLVNTVNSTKVGRYYFSKINVNDDYVTYTNNEYYWNNDFISSIITDYAEEIIDFDSYYQRAIGTVREWTIRTTASLQEKVVSFIPDDNYDKNGIKQPRVNFYVLSVEFNTEDAFKKYDVMSTPWGNLVEAEISEDYYSEVTDFMLNNLVGPSLIGGGKIDDVMVNGESVVEDKIAYVEVPTKVSELENDEDYMTDLDVSSSIVAASPSIDTQLNKNSYNAVINKAITEGIDISKITRVDSITNTFPEATALGQSVLNTTNNKIHATTYKKEINPAYTINGSLNINNIDGSITGFNQENYITITSEWWHYMFPLRLQMKMDGLGNYYYDVDVPTFIIYRNDDNSVLFEMRLTCTTVGNYAKIIFNAYKRDGSIIESSYVDFTRTKNIYSENDIFVLDMVNGSYSSAYSSDYGTVVNLTQNGKIIFSKLFKSLKTSYSSTDSDFYYNLGATAKIISKYVGSDSGITGGLKGITTIYGSDSYIREGSYGPATKHYFSVNSNTIIWDEGQELTKDKVIYNAEDNSLYEYDGTNLNRITAHITIDSELSTTSENPVQNKVITNTLNAEVNDLQQQIDAVTAASDVKDIVGTYQELMDYDTSKLGNNDIVKVLEDSEHNNSSTYYRWIIDSGDSDSDSGGYILGWNYIGSEGPYYTKSETDILLDEKQDTLVSGTNIKTVNGNSLLGSGNVTIRTYQSYNPSWPTNTTFDAFLAAIDNDSAAVEGMAYIGDLRCTGLPLSGNLEAVVEIINNNTDSKCIHVIATSGSDAPYRWEYTYWNHGLQKSGWIGFQPELPSQTGNSGKFLTTNGSDLSWGEVPTTTMNTINRSLTAGTASLNTGVDLSQAVILAVYINGLYQISSNNYTITTTDNVSTLTLTDTYSEDVNITILYLTAFNLTNISYNSLSNKPGINNVELNGNKSAAELGLQTALPTQSGNNGKFLSTDGSSMSWQEVDALPSQSGQSGKYLTTDGTTASWQTVDALPDQTGNNGKFLTTNGTNASWTELNVDATITYFDSSNWTLDVTNTILSTGLNLGNKVNVFKNGQLLQPGAFNSVSTTVGNPTIQNGISSNMNTSNYVRFLRANYLLDNDWEICLKVYWDSSSTNVYASISDYATANYFRIESSGGFSFNGYLTNNNSVWVHHGSCFHYKPAGWYYIALKYTYSTGDFAIYSGTSPENMVQNYHVEKGEHMQLRNLTSSKYVFSQSPAQIDLKESYVKVGEDKYPIIFKNDYIVNGNDINFTDELESTDKVAVINGNMNPMQSVGYNTFSNKSILATDWVSDNTYSGYSYKCDIPCTGVTSTMYAQVTFAPEEAMSGNYANICDTGTEVVTIYSKVNDAITIPMIMVLGV